MYLNLFMYVMISGYAYHKKYMSIEFGKKGMESSPERPEYERLQRYTPQEVLGILHGKDHLSELDRWEEIQAHGFSGGLDDRKIIEGLEKDIMKRVQELVGDGKEKEITREIITRYVAQRILGQD